MFRNTWTFFHAQYTMINQLNRLSRVRILEMLDRVRILEMLDKCMPREKCLKMQTLDYDRKTDAYDHVIANHAS